MKRLNFFRYDKEENCQDKNLIKMELAQKELRSFSKEDEWGLERITWQFELTGKSDPIVENQSLWTVFLFFGLCLKK